jgi:uncharacterized lipoprotein YddW (UPF0748 family)
MRKRQRKPAGFHHLHRKHPLSIERKYTRNFKYRNSHREILHICMIYSYKSPESTVKVREQQITPEEEGFGRFALQQILKVVISLCMAVFLFLFNIKMADGQETRALWVTRWDYRSAADLQKIFANAANFRFNVILFQVRGNGTVFYPSDIEPWAEELGGKHPGWDPLATALSYAGRFGLELHAWINVFPAWRGSKPPRHPNQLFNAHRNWFLRNEDGELLPPNNHYSWLDPALPQVQAHLSLLVKELANNYPSLSGIHFDYFRYPGPGTWIGKSPTSDKEGRPVPPSDPRLAAITQWLRNIRAESLQSHPELRLSAAIIGDYLYGPKLFFQDSHNWLTEGLLDAAFAMTYTDDLKLLYRWLRRHRFYAASAQIFPGIYVYPDTSVIRKSVLLGRLMGFHGMALFAYSLLFPNHRPNELAHYLRDVVFTFPARPVWPERKKGIFISHFTPLKTDNRYQLNLAVQLSHPAAPDTVTLLTISPPANWTAAPQIAQLYPWRASAKRWILSLPVPDVSLHPTFFFPFLVWGQTRSGQPIHSETAFLVHPAAKKPFIPEQIPFGPLMYGVNTGVIDTLNQFWFYDSRQGLTALRLSDGEIIGRFSLPIDGKGEHPEKILGMALSSCGKAVLLAQMSGPTITALSLETGTVKWLTSYSVSEPPVAATLDRQGTLYILYRRGWTAVSPDGQNKVEIRFKRIHTPNNIAVSRNGHHVYIACRTEGTVHHWFRTKNHSYRSRDARIPDLGLGYVHTGPSGRLFVGLPHLGAVLILSPDLEPVGILTAPRGAPRSAISAADGRSLILLEMGGMTPVRCQKWVEFHSFRKQ